MDGYSQYPPRIKQIDPGAERAPGDTAMEGKYVVITIIG